MSGVGQDTPSGTILQYAINPPKVFVSTTTDLTLVITNPLNSGQTVTFRPGAQGDLVEVTFTGQQAVTDDFNFASQSLTTGFTAGTLSPGSGVFNVQPTSLQKLEPGQTIKVLFPAVVVNGQTGTAQVQIEEFIGDSDETTTVSVERVAQELRVISWIDPQVIGLGQKTTLRWISFAGTKVKVSGFPGGTGEQTFPVHGDPPHPDSTQVGVAADEGFRTYTLTVYTNDNKHAKDEATVYQNPPVISSLDGDPPTGSVVRPNQPVLLTWGTLFGQYAYLITPTANAPADLNVSTPVRVVPGDDAFASAGGGPVPGQVTYELFVGGYKRGATQDVTYTISPVKILYFKYNTRDPGTGKLSGVSWKLDPPTWRGVRVTGAADLSKIAVTQPGAPDTVWWLGSGDTAHPQVQFFDASAATSGAYTLRWVTANVKSLVLSWNDGSPQSYAVPSGDVAGGVYNVTPKGSTQYLLTATGANGEVVTSALTAGAPA
jgi:hypothetical protein